MIFWKVTEWSLVSLIFIFFAISRIILEQSLWNLSTVLHFKELNFLRNQEDDTSVISIFYLSDNSVIEVLNKE